MSYHLTVEDFNKFYFNNDGATFKTLSKIFGVPTSSVCRDMQRLGLRAKTYKTAWNSGLTSKEDTRILSKENHPRWKGVSKYLSDFKRIRQQILDGKTQCYLLFLFLLKSSALGKEKVTRSFHSDFFPRFHWSVFE